MEYHPTALVCMNGHCITSDLENHPECAAKYCNECGAKTIGQCPSCNERIQGAYDITYSHPVNPYSPPKYCSNCGKPFPWTKIALQAAKELIQEDESLDDSEKRAVSESLTDIITETPRTPLAATRLKKLMPKIGDFTLEGMRQFLTDYGCDIALKLTGIS